MDMISRYAELKNKAIQRKGEIKSLKNTLDNTKEQYNSLLNTLEKEKSNLNLQNVSVDVFKEIIDRMSQEEIERIASLLTYALKVIFYDKDYQVEVITADKRNAKTAELVLVEKTEDRGYIRSSFSDAIGGGILAVCGLVMQVYYISLLNQSPVLFMDEALSQVSSEYVPTMMAFIKELADTKNFILVLISHDNRYISYADRTYRVEDGVVEEVVNGNSEE